MEGVVSVFPNTVLKFHTTRSWDFIGLTQTVKRQAEAESNMIIGLLDSGIYVDSPSFDDKGYGPPPAKWKGSCAKGANFTGCNNKVIGARYSKLGDSYSNGTGTPTDTEGHGTHTASTVAGSPVKNAKFYGLAKGTARGGVPSARIAMYKGLSINTFSPEKKMYPLITGAQASNNTDDTFGASSSCEAGTLDKKKVKGKIVYCIPETEGGGSAGRDYTVKQSGGAGIIVQSLDKMDTAFTFVLPAAYVNYDEGGAIDHYINTTKNAQAIIRKTITVITPAPFVASFTSREPNSVTTNILKGWIY